MEAWIFTPPLELKSFIQDGVPHFRLDKNRHNISIRRVNTRSRLSNPLEPCSTLKSSSLEILLQAMKALKAQARTAFTTWMSLARTEARIVQNRLEGQSSSFADIASLTPMEEMSSGSNAGTHN